MNRLMRKCNNKIGASMIIALVFLLFCTFVSGSVLTAATVNGYRIEHLSDQQDYLNQRSAAMLMADELKKIPAGAPEESEILRMDVEDCKKTIRRVVVNPDGSYDIVEEDKTNPTIVREITFSFKNDVMLTPLQRMLYESAVARYIGENLTEEEKRNTAIKISTTKYQTGVDADNHPIYADPPIDHFNQFWNCKDMGGGKYELSPEGTLTVTDSAGSMSFPDFDVNFVCSDGSGAGTNIYDFYVSFGTESQMKLDMAASAGTYTYPAQHKLGKTQVVSVDPDGNPIYDAEHHLVYHEVNAFIQVEAKQTAVSWINPVISKGGAR